MSSAWGKSWGLAFGAAFGLVASIPAEAPTYYGSGQSRHKHESYEVIAKSRPAVEAPKTDFVAKAIEAQLAKEAAQAERQRALDEAKKLAREAAQAKKLAREIAKAEEKRLKAEEAARIAAEKAEAKRLVLEAERRDKEEARLATIKLGQAVAVSQAAFQKIERLKAKELARQQAEERAQALKAAQQRARDEAKALAAKALTIESPLSEDAKAKRDQALKEEEQIMTMMAMMLLED